MLIKPVKHTHALHTIDAERLKTLITTNCAIINEKQNDTFHSINTKAAYYPDMQCWPRSHEGWPRGLVISHRKHVIYVMLIVL